MPASTPPPNPPPAQDWRTLLELSLAEDVGPGDVTTEIVVGPEAQGRVRIEARQDLVACGLFVAKEVFQHVEPGVRLSGVRARAVSALDRRPRPNGVCARTASASERRLPPSGGVA